MPMTKTRAVWRGLLSGFLADRPVVRIIATHFHPDHVGLAGWIADKTGADLSMTRTEWLTARMLKLDDVPISSRSARRRIDGRGSIRN